jgi:pimeloyl-ACP methyl ester carboxylesterase
MLRPRCVAVLGLQAYRTAFRRPGATIGPQPELLGDALLWLLPNPSGLQARYQMPEMSEMYKSLFVATATTWSRHHHVPDRSGWWENRVNITVSHAEAFSRTVQHGQLAVVPGTSHLLPMERPALYNQLVLEFTANPEPETMMPLWRNAGR